MLKKVFVMNYPEDVPFQESEDRYLEVHTQLAKKIPGIIKYVTYKSITVPEVEMIPEPNFCRLTEIWWDSMDDLKASAGSPQVISVLKDNLKPDGTPRFKEMRDVTLTDEVNLLRPEAGSRKTMNELGGQPTVKLINTVNYPPGVSNEEGDEWFFKQHAPLMAKVPGLLRFVTYTTTMAPGDKEPSFYRYIELWWQDVEAALSAFASTQGQAAIADNVAPDGSPRMILENPFFDGPAVAGFEINIV